MGTDGDGEATYELAGRWRRWPWIFGGVILVNAVAVLAMGAQAEGWLHWLALVFAPFGAASAVYIFLWTPRVVRVGEAEVSLVAPARTIAIPWKDLVAVDVADSGLGTALVWTRRHGRRIHTVPPWERQDEMVAAIRLRMNAAEGAPDH